jgi:hypothetical protein
MDNKIVDIVLCHKCGGAGYTIEKKYVSDNTDAVCINKKIRHPCTMCDETGRLRRSITTTFERIDDE